MSRGGGGESSGLDGKFAGHAGSATPRRALDQDALVAVITSEISANSDHCRDCDAQERCPRAFGIAEDDGLPEVEKPDAWPPSQLSLLPLASMPAYSPWSMVTCLNHTSRTTPQASSKSYPP
jgi:hypothetical protein